MPSVALSEMGEAKKEYMGKKIITIGYEIPGHRDWYFSFSSDQSLLDADIVVFEANFRGYTRDYLEPNFRGKPLYDTDSSFKLQEDSRRWSRELATALKAGKTVFVFFKKFEEIYVYTGDKKFSGTGKNARTTNIVTEYDNYRFLPMELSGTIESSNGKEISSSGHPAFSSFWDTFGGYLKYESYLDGKVNTPLFVTKTGGKVVGALFRVTGGGNLVLLPVLDDSERKPEFGNKLVKAFVDIDKTLRNDSAKTQPPDWANDKDFKLAQEQSMRKEVERRSVEIDKLTSEKNELLEKINKESELRGLLFEKGKALENVVIYALEILGYKAENYDDGNLELDQVIISPEGDRFIGETEGKDKSAINIDKFRQLSANVQEDFKREEITTPAAGILFGNGFRITDSRKREELFTTKCVQAAKSFNHILVRTPDLFQVVKHIRESGDDDFAKSCRDAIKNSLGQIVEFPSIPKE